MNRIINILNWLSDQDWGWWPLLKFRPNKNQFITTKMVLQMTPVFGTLSGLAIAVVAQHLFSIQYLAIDVVVGWVLYFAIYRATFVPAWNARARSWAAKNA
jgi:hypothetical protein